METLSNTHGSNLDADGSDYGSEIDDATLEDLLVSAESQPLSPPPSLSAVQSIEEPVLPDEPDERPSAARLPRLWQPTTTSGTAEDSRGIITISQRIESPIRLPSVEVEYDQSNRRSFSPSNVEETRLFEASVPQESPKEDTRSPLERFRTPPKKTLSVTDIVSPAWCELQYFYSLTKYGRVRKTPAMKQGSKVHKTLEEQVHREVAVEVATREDAFGLRIWNAIQGLRTLRTTGMTRELEVWGIVEGQVINGIIDEINTRCPDERMEAAMMEDSADQQSKKDGRSKKKDNDALPAGQRTLGEYLTSSQPGHVLENGGWIGGFEEKTKSFYIVDIKTRKSRSLPSTGSQMHPTKMQLSLYHRLFTDMASKAIESSKVFARYNLRAHNVFSDVFIAQIGQLDNFTPEASEQDDVVAFQPSQDSVGEILRHNTPHLLWQLLVDEFEATVPDPAASVSPLLTAEFRDSSSGSLIGKRSFALDQTQADAYVMDEMRWWRGERPTRGVDIEEAFKCRICDFADGCTWRAEKVEKAVEEAKRKNNLRKTERAKSIV